MGILGILMAVTILVINPAEYLRRSRDTQRINDLQTINSALGLYLANGGTLTSIAYCVPAYNTGTTAVAISCNGGAVTSTIAAASIRNINNTGWVKGIDFSSASYFPGGSPFASLAVDPASNATYYYLWTTSASAYELNATGMESTYYTSTNDVAENDGGNNTTRYELGTSLTLIN